MGCAKLGQVVLGYIRKQTEQAMIEQVSSSIVSASVPVLASPGDGHIKPFILQLFFKIQRNKERKRGIHLTSSYPLASKCLCMCV